MRVSLLLAVLCCAPARADLVFTFSQIPSETGTRLEISGNGLLDGLNATPSIGINDSGAYVSIDRANERFRALDSLGVLGNVDAFLTEFEVSGTSIVSGIGGGEMFSDTTPAINWIADHGNNDISGVHFNVKLDAMFNTNLYLLRNANDQDPAPTAVELLTGQTFDFSGINFLTSFVQGEVVFTNPNGTAGSNTITFTAPTALIPVAVPEPSAALYGLAVIAAAWAKKKLLG